MRSGMLHTPLFAALALSFALISCATTPKNTTPPKPDANAIAADVARVAQENYSVGRFRKALQIYSDTYDKYHYSVIRRGYQKMGEQIRVASDTALQRKDYAGAGTGYSTLFDSGITTRDFASSLSFDDAYLEKQIAVCSKALTEVGLMRYREEKLEEAILEWKKVVAFDPENGEVRNAIDKATVQLHQLKSLK